MHIKERCWSRLCFHCVHAKVASDLARVALALGSRLMAGGELLGLQDMFPRMGSQTLQPTKACHRLNSSPPRSTLTPSLSARAHMQERLESKKVYSSNIKDDEKFETTTTKKTQLWISITNGKRPNLGICLLSLKTVLKVVALVNASKLFMPVNVFWFQMLCSCLPEGQWLNSPRAPPDEVKNLQNKSCKSNVFCFLPGILITWHIP